MPAVQSGNVMKVDAVLSSLRDMVQDQTSGKQKSKGAYIHCVYYVQCTCQWFPMHAVAKLANGYTTYSS